jgi:hypothetical protein
MVVQDKMIVFDPRNLDLGSTLPTAFTVLGHIYSAGTLTELCLSHNDAAKAQPETQFLRPAEVHRNSV